MGGEPRDELMASMVAALINDLRERAGLRGTDVANVASVSPTTVSRWTAGASLPHPKTQLLISDLAMSSIGWLSSTTLGKRGSGSAPSAGCLRGAGLSI
jgi:transcriptional regulator with XRE-family HTH domain